MRYSIVVTSAQVGTYLATLRMFENKNRILEHCQQL